MIEVEAEPITTSSRGPARRSCFQFGGWPVECSPDALMPNAPEASLSITTGADAPIYAAENHDGASNIIGNGPATNKANMALIKSHPKATRAYAWSSPIEGSTKRRFFAVLHIPPIVSPLDAVRAAIVAEHRLDKTT